MTMAWSPTPRPPPQKKKQKAKPKQPRPEHAPSIPTPPPASGPPTPSHFLHCLLTPVLLLLRPLPPLVVLLLRMLGPPLQLPPRLRPHQLRFARGRGRQDGSRSCAALRLLVQRRLQGDLLARLREHEHGERQHNMLRRGVVDMVIRLTLRPE